MPLFLGTCRPSWPFEVHAGRRWGKRSMVPNFTPSLVGPGDPVDPAVRTGFPCLVLAPITADWKQ